MNSTTLKATVIAQRRAGVKQSDIVEALGASKGYVSAICTRAGMGDPYGQRLPTGYLKVIPTLTKEQSALLANPSTEQIPEADRIIAERAAMVKEVGIPYRPHGANHSPSEPSHEVTHSGALDAERTDWTEPTNGEVWRFYDRFPGRFKTHAEARRVLTEANRAMWRRTA